ncbi:MAG: cobalamin-dependent protein [Phycisphaerales bacterium]|nr:cobalamin-dependent protein [Phycisphaerales bacterium]MCI0629946.1 cobalamin-dependent protein [Phycisphaerales bacterium]MCI0675363.1 cobalamin-dependent protein [Phycisphaerales bacterium]
MPLPTTEPTTSIEKADRVGDLPHRPRVLLGKMGLDGHDRGVKLIARALRDSGIHVIYSGLWQTPRSLAISARDEDVDCIASSMMSNSHLVLVPRLIEQCAKVGRPDMIVNVGGIIPQEDVQTLIDVGVRQVFHTGASMNEIVQSVRDATTLYTPLKSDHAMARLAREISMVHANSPLPLGEGSGVRAGGTRGHKKVGSQSARTPSPRPSPKGRGSRPAQVVGITGSPGAGKSTLVAGMAAEIVRRGGKVAVIAFDPMSPITSGALLGDRLRVDFNTVDENVFYRSLAIVGEDYSTLPAIVDLIGGAGFDKLIVETVGAGQNDVAIRNYVDRTAVVVVPGMGDSVQMDKAGILEIADVFVVNKADFPGENKLVRELKDVAARRPIFETIATQGQGVVQLLDGLLR